MVMNTRVKMSKLGIVLDDWMQRYGIDATGDTMLGFAAA
jgi:hypothetical protein